jgi:hypothetical protein
LSVVKRLAEPSNHPTISPGSCLAASVMIIGHLPTLGTFCYTVGSSIIINLLQLRMSRSYNGLVFGKYLPGGTSVHHSFYQILLYCEFLEDKICQ